MTIDVTHEREISSSSDIVKWNRQGGDTMLISRTMSNIWEKTTSKDANKVQASQTSKLNQICVRFFLMKSEYILDNITQVEKKIQTGSSTTKMFVKRLVRWCLKENCFFFCFFFHIIFSITICSCMLRFSLPVRAVQVNVDLTLSPFVQISNDSLWLLLYFRGICFLIVYQGLVFGSAWLVTLRNRQRIYCFMNTESTPCKKKTSGIIRYPIHYPKGNIERIPEPKKFDNKLNCTNCTR